MFRLVALTFHGERRHEAPAAAGHHDPHAGHGHGGGHGHDAHHGHGAPHDAPPAMALALVVLAIGSVLAGYVGVPHALGGSNALATWLEPALTAPAGAEAPVAAGTPAEHADGAEHGGEAAHGEEALELTLMGVSSAIAVIGVGLGLFVWTRRRDIADGMARSLAPAHRLLLNKYYVDEVYDAAVVQPIKVVSTEGLWRAFDVGLIDGAVNGVAAIVGAGATVLRRLQTGSVRAYAGSVLVGAVMVIGYYLWR
jgi:NADH-quinone oxidoreductase subunit L